MPLRGTTGSSEADADVSTSDSTSGDCDVVGSSVHQEIEDTKTNCPGNIGAPRVVTNPGPSRSIPEADGLLIGRAILPAHRCGIGDHRQETKVLPDGDLGEWSGVPDRGRQSIRDHVRAIGS